VSDCNHFAIRIWSGSKVTKLEHGTLNLVYYTEP